jgi:hypothetical protein
LRQRRSTEGCNAEHSQKNTIHFRWNFGVNVADLWSLDCLYRRDLDWFTAAVEPKSFRL